MKFMRTLRSGRALLPLVLLAACATPPGRDSPTWVSVNDVLAKPSEVDGKVVTIKGWASIRHEDYGIWATQADYESRNWKQCISLLNFYSDDALNKSLDRTTVLITGIIQRDVFHDKDGGAVVRLGTCNQMGIRFVEPTGLSAFPN